MQNFSIALAILGGFALLGGTYYATETEKEHLQILAQQKVEEQTAQLEVKAQPKPKAEPRPVAQTGALNESFTLSNLKYTVVSASSKKKTEQSLSLIKEFEMVPVTTELQGRVVTIRIELENVGKTTAEHYRVALLDDEQRQFTQSMFGWKPLNGDVFAIDSAIKPGFSNSYEVNIEVSDSSKNLRLGFANDEGTFVYYVPLGI